MESEFIEIRGAREHNLKNINIDIPRNQMIVITGLSGSGKSSLAFDTIYAEGQRRYVESLSSYARQFLDLQNKPDVDSITGLSPAIAIDQRTSSRNPRSTVGTVTEIYDYLRLLYARVGVPYSPTTGLPIESQTISQMVDVVAALPEGSKVMLMAPIVRGRKGEYAKEIADLQKKGFTRIKLDGKVYEIGEHPPLDRQKKHEISVVVDRVIIKPDLNKRLADSFETALKLADGIAHVEVIGDKILTFSEKFACPVSGFMLEEIEPRIFSFNSPYGACPACDGLGSEKYYDPDLIVPDGNKSLEDGAIAPWASASSKFHVQALAGLAKHFKFRLDTPFNKLSDEIKNIILHGSGEESIQFQFEDGMRRQTSNKPFEGVIPSLERRWKEAEGFWIRDEMERYQNHKHCAACDGHRLKPEALCVKVGEKHIGEVCRLSVDEALEWFAKLPKKLSKKQNEIAEKVLKEISNRLGFLVNVGLDYLTLGRESGTLSGGEAQRIRLASQIGSGLTGVLYVLDEPSIGLHQCDNDRLLDTLRHLRDLGNTVIVVEHDEDTMRAADYLIDIGLGAGVNGGRVIAKGTPKQVTECKESITGQYLKGSKFIPLPAERRKMRQGRKIEVIGARANNLKNVNVEIPLGCFVCFTGVSGGGKSSIVIETLYKSIAKTLHHAKDAPGPHDRITGIEYLDKCVEIDQSPIGRTPRSNPATYVGAFTPIRDWFAGLPEAKARGYKSGRFSFNVKGGRCEACQGDGVTKIEMHFLPDVYVTCDVCKGQRYNRETLEVTYKGKTITDILNMTVDEALPFFSNLPAVKEKMQALQEVGLGYIGLGQSATTLSGGEAQRIKLARELSRRATGRTLYILDEPTTGLHSHDIAKLLQVLHSLVESGNSVLVIEHNLDVIKTADWIIDIGPGGGIKGGEVIASGTPEEVCKNKNSITGRYLKPYLSKKLAA